MVFVSARDRQSHQTKGRVEKVGRIETAKMARLEKMARENTEEKMVKMPMAKKERAKVEVANGLRALTTQVLSFAHLAQFASLRPILPLFIIDESMNSDDTFLMSELFEFLL